MIKRKKRDYDTKIWRQRVAQFMREFSCRGAEHTPVKTYFYAFKRYAKANAYCNQIPFGLDSFGRLLDGRYSRRVVRIRGVTRMSLINRSCTY